MSVWRTLQELVETAITTCARWINASMVFWGWKVDCVGRGLDLELRARRPLHQGSFLRLA